jgi:hypothetical protein
VASVDERELLEAVGPGKVEELEEGDSGELPVCEGLVFGLPKIAG